MTIFKLIAREKRGDFLAHQWKQQVAKQTAMAMHISVSFFHLLSQSPLLYICCFSRKNLVMIPIRNINLISMYNMRTHYK